MKPHRIIWAYVAVLALCMPAAHAQTQQVQGTGTTGPIAPVAPIRQLPMPAARGLGLEPAQGSSQVRGDTHTLSSIETLTVGSLGVVGNIFDPSFSFTQSGQTGVTTGATSSATSLGVNLSIDRNWTRSRLTGFYGGAHVMYYPDSSRNTAYHNLAIAQEFHSARWVLRLRDDLLLSPEASFGGFDTGGLDSSSGVSALNSLQPSAGTSETILTQRAERLRNTASGEVNYFLSRRSIVTFAGSYASLKFLDAGFIDSHRAAGRVGYDYILAPKDTIALMYDYSRTDFDAASGRLQTDTVQISYGRRVSGRLAFQIAAGPQQLRSQLHGRSLDWTVSTAMTFQTRRSQYSLSYSRAPSAGSGVFLGADSHNVTASFRHALTQSWSSSLGAGYAFDQTLAPVSGGVSRFHNWYSDASLERPLGRHLHFNLSYRFHGQSAGSGACPVLACGSIQSRQMLGMTLQWHPWSISPR